MNKRYTALALASALATPMIVQAEAPTVYGRAHLSFDYLDNGDEGAANVSSNSSRLGFKGSHELDYGLTGIYQIEGEVFFDAGQNTSFNSRDTFAGIRGDFGMIRLGRFDSPMKRVRSRTDLFGDQVGDARNITRGALSPHYDDRLRNSIHYQTPALGPITLDVQYATSQSGSDTGGEKNSDVDAISASITFAQGPVGLIAAYEQFSGGDDDPSAFRLGGWYDIADFRFTAFYQGASDDPALGDTDVYGIGARYRIGAGAIKAQYYANSVDPDDADSSMFAIGYEHRLASNFTSYVNYAMVSNDDNANLVPYNQARSTGNLDAVAGETTSGVSVGMIYNF